MCCLTSWIWETITIVPGWSSTLWQVVAHPTKKHVHHIQQKSLTYPTHLNYSCKLTLLDRRTWTEGNVNAAYKWRCVKDRGTVVEMIWRGGRASNSVLQTTQFALWHTNKVKLVATKDVKTDFDMFANFYYTHMYIDVYIYVCICLYMLPCTQCFPLGVVFQSHWWWNV